MPLNRGTQKQIAQRFKGNLDYFRKAHYWRRLRFWIILAVSLIGIGVMAFFFAAGPETIYNPGPISSHHASFAEDCSKCHEPVPRSLTVQVKVSNERIDERCAECHKGLAFHQPNVVHERSCTACHQEHNGPGAMAMPGDVQCSKCHGSVQALAASAEKGQTLAAGLFNFRKDFGWKVFHAARPATGFTAVVTSFADNHPEFRLLADKARETNTLKFNHRRHLTETNDIPLIQGRRIDCAFCHQPGPGGAFFQPVSYEKNCRVCHSLQLDDQVPELTVPHGRPEHVRAFLRSLPTHYAEVALRRTNAAAENVDQFVSRQMLRLREQFVDGTNLEREVFFTALRKGSDGRAKFDGCATCHEVRAQPTGAPLVNPPYVPDRWMPRARFDHSKHTSVACAKCHDATRSADTADIIMPGKASCVDCHSPKGRVASDCSFCHKYHNSSRELTTGVDDLKAVRTKLGVQ
jgi:hypothetical protein